jgi:type II secretory pathway pseudopilin PulG
LIVILQRVEAVFRMHKKEAGFTLIELLLVVTVVMTLALIAIPSYVKSKKRAIAKEGIANIKLIAAAERIYNMENGAYTVCTNATTCNDALKLMLIATNWAYSANVFGNITAESQSSTGMTCTYSLTPSTYDDEPAATAGCP